MRTKNLRCKPASIANRRWATYASAAAATALAGSQSAEAAIHYSGHVNEGFHGEFDERRTFTLDQPGDFFVLSRSTYEYGIKIDRFYNFGIGSAAVRGGCCLLVYPYVAKLRIGENVSDGPFFSVFGHGYGLMAYADALGQWSRHGVGFIGFRFSNGAGVQYGWVRILMGRIPGAGAFFNGLLEIWRTSTQPIQSAGEQELVLPSTVHFVVRPLLGAFAGLILFLFFATGGLSLTYQQTEADLSGASVGTLIYQLTPHTGSQLATTILLTFVGGYFFPLVPELLDAYRKRMLPKPNSRKR